MYIPGLNTLQEPEITRTEPYEQQLASFKQVVVGHIAGTDEALAAQVSDTLENEAELSTKIVEACCVVLQNHVRKINADAQQMYAVWAGGSNLDAKAADLGVKRQVVSPGDPAAYPPVPPEHEEDDHLRLRYFLAPHAPAAGSRMYYRHEVLTLDERAHVSVEAPEPGLVTVSYRLKPEGWAAQIKDGNGLRAEPGEVVVTVLARAGNGSPSAELISAVDQHFQRPDVAPGTDGISVQGAEIVPYRIHAVARIGPGPDGALIQSAGNQALAELAAEQHRLGGVIDPGMIYHRLHAVGASRVDLQEPLAAVECTEQQAPWCSEIQLEVVPL